MEHQHEDPPGRQRSSEPSGRHATGYSSENTAHHGHEIVGDATAKMKHMLAYTLETYPPHYQAACRALHDQVAGAQAFQCVGAMETCLSEDGMTVAFDFRRDHPAWARLIIWVTMSFGEIQDIGLRAMQPGEHCGIDAFEEVY